MSEGKGRTGNSADGQLASRGCGPSTPYCRVGFKRIGDTASSHICLTRPRIPSPAGSGGYGWDAVDRLALQRGGLRVSLKVSSWRAGRHRKGESGRAGLHVPGVDWQYHSRCGGARLLSGQPGQAAPDGHTESGGTAEQRDEADGGRSEERRVNGRQLDRRRRGLGPHHGVVRPPQLLASVRRTWQRGYCRWR